MENDKKPKPAPQSHAQYIPEAKTEARSVTAVKVPTLELPKGGGAIRGIGETFSTNLAMGTGGMSIPVAVSPGRGGAAPQLAVTYSSGSGQSLFGVGWSMAVPSVRRRTDKQLPTYNDRDEEDVFLFAGEEELVPALVSTSGGWVRDVVEVSVTTSGGPVTERRERFRPRTEGSFHRIERITRPDAAVPFWRVTDRSNGVSEFGRQASTRVSDPASNGRRVFEWLLERQYDDRGNVTEYHYKQEDGAGVTAAMFHEHHRTGDAYGARHLKRIFYSNRDMYEPSGEAVPAYLDPEDFLFEVVVDYGDHASVAPTPDDALDWSLRVDAFSSYRSGFELRTQRQCKRVLMFHRIDDADEAVLVKSTDFTYATEAGASRLTEVHHRSYRANGEGYDTDAMPPVSMEYAPAAFSQSLSTMPANSLVNAPEELDGSRYRWVAEPSPQF